MSALSASEDMTVRVWDPATGRELVRTTPDDEMVGVAFSPDGSRLATGEDRSVSRPDQS